MSKIILILCLTTSLFAIGDAPHDLGKYLWPLKPFIDLGRGLAKLAPKKPSSRLGDYEKTLCEDRSNKEWRVNYILDNDNLHDEEILDFMYDYHTDKQNNVLGKKHKKILQCIIKNDAIKRTQKIELAYLFFIEENYDKVIEKLHSFISNGDEQALWIYYALTKDNCQLYNFYQKDTKDYIPICPNAIDSTSINDAKEIVHNERNLYAYKREHNLENYTIALFEDEIQKETQVKIKVDYKNKQVPYTILDYDKKIYQEERMSDENGYGTFTYTKGAEIYFFTAPRRFSMITVLEILLDKEKDLKNNITPLSIQ